MLSVKSALFVFWGAALILVSSCNKPQAGMGSGMAGGMPPVAVRAVEAVASDVPLQVTSVGTVEALNSVDVKSRVAGQVLRVDFQEGQDVKKGQPLFEIDPEPLQRQIAELKADVTKDVAMEAQARANVTKDTAQLKQARSSADRGLELSKDGIFSKEQTEQVVATADAAQASEQADRAAVESAMAAHKADSARLAQTELQLSYTKITAPISGRAGAIAIKAGNLVKENDVALVTLLEISPVYVSFGLPEQFLAPVRTYNAQQPLTIQATVADSPPQTGKLSFIDNSVDAATGTVKLKATFENSKRILWPGQFVNVRVDLNVEHDRVLVPSRTVQTGPQGKYVWVMDAGTNTVAMRPVNVLRLYQSPAKEEQAVVGTGLHGGEMVISEGQMRLAPGAKVQLLKPATQLGSSSQTDSASQS